MIIIIVTITQYFNWTCHDVFQFCSVSWSHFQWLTWEWTHYFNQIVYLAAGPCLIPLPLPTTSLHTRIRLRSFTYRNLSKMPLNGFRGRQFVVHSFCTVWRYIPIVYMEVHYILNAVYFVVWIPIAECVGSQTMKEVPERTQHLASSVKELLNRPLFKCR